jgi:hypothetical protein
MTELNRLIRHGVAPLVAWLVASGYLPEYMQGDVTELLVVGIAIGAPLAVSWWRDRART